MPVKVETDNWVCVFRDQIKDSIVKRHNGLINAY